MIEQFTNLWETPGDARCITTNGSITSRGTGVMGRGCAKQAADRYPNLPTRLGAGLRLYGNVVQILALLPDGPLVAFPVKHRWNERADLDLIAQSVQQLIALADRDGWQTVVLPRPGVGNGLLPWEKVRPLLAPLDDRFIVVAQLPLPIPRRV